MFPQFLQYSKSISALIFAVYIWAIAANIFHVHSVDLLAGNNYAQSSGSGAAHQSAAAYYEFNSKCAFHVQFNSLTSMYWVNDAVIFFKAENKNTYLLPPCFVLRETINGSALYRGPPQQV